MFMTVGAASAHLAKGTISYEEDDDDDSVDGAFKVLIAAASPDAPRFYPRVNLRECRVEQSVVACAPPVDDERLSAPGEKSTVDEDDFWQYADDVLQLLSESCVPCLQAGGLTAADRPSGLGKDHH